LNAYVLVSVAASAYLVVVAVGHMAGVWKRFGIALYGPIMMLKTRRGQRLMRRLARREGFWRAFGPVAFCVVLLATVLLTALLLSQVGVRTDEQSAAPENGLPFDAHPPPGSPLLTAVFVAAGFAAAVAIHELAHGVMAIVAKIQILSVGLLFFVIPIGAFVEPDDGQLRRSSRRSREGLYAMGPAANMLAAATFLLLAGVLGSCVQPVSPGAVVTDVAEGSPASLYGIEPWSEIVSVGGAPVLNSSQMRSVSFAEPGELVSVGVVYRSSLEFIEVPGGVVLQAVYEGPGHDAGLRPGMIVTSVNHTPINSVSEFRSATENASVHEPVEIGVMSYDASANGGRGGFVPDPSVGTVNLTSKWLYYRTHYPWANREEFRNVSFMAVSVSPLGAWTEDPDYLTDIVARPFGSGHDHRGLAEGLGDYLGLPIAGFYPVVSPASDLYAPGGALGFIPREVYWTLVNLVYWLFWANLMLGLTNALPALPFDGGYLLRDLLKGLSGWREGRVPGLDKVIGRRIVTEDTVDDIMLFVSGAVISLVAYILLSGAVGNAMGR